MYKQIYDDESIIVLYSLFHFMWQSISVCINFFFSILRVCFLCHISVRYTHCIASLSLSAQLPRTASIHHIWWCLKIHDLNKDFWVLQTYILLLDILCGEHLCSICTMYIVHTYTVYVIYGIIEINVWNYRYVVYVISLSSFLLRCLFATHLPVDAEYTQERATAAYTRGSVCSR